MMKTSQTLAPRILRAAAACLFLTTSAWAADISIDFDNLNTGDLVGGSTWSTAGNQDKWYLGQGGAFKVEDRTGHGKVLTATAANAYNYYLNGSNFYTGTETSAVLQFDANIAATWSGLNVGLTGNGTQSWLHGAYPQDYGALLGVSRTSGNIVIKLKLQTGVGTQTSYTSTVSLAPNDWYSFKLVMDFTANSGNGSASVYYKDLTTSGEWTAAADLQSLALGLNYAQTGFTASNWNQVVLQGSQASTGIYLDNIVIAAVPEPATYAMLVGGMGLLAFGQRLRRRNA